MRRTGNPDQDLARPLAALALALALSSGCTPAQSSTSPAPDGAPADVELEKFVAQQVAFDPLLLKPGDWALYTLRVQGAPRAEHFKWTVVGADAKGLWVENKVPHADTGMIRKARYDRAGKLLEAWIGPPGGVPAQVWPKPGAAEPAPPRPAPPAAFRETAEPATAAGKVFRCTKVASEASYPDGRKVPVVSWFSTDVPFPGQARLGGLVRRQVGRATMELVDAGSGRGRPELEIPK
jgi:hypothetical protein